MRRVVLAIVSTVASLVMLLSFKTQAASPVTTPPAAVSTTGSSDTGTTTSSGTATSSGTTTSTTTKAAGSTSKTVTGDAVQTRYGPVQVQVTVTNGKVTAVTAVDYPQSNPRDAQINAYAIPVLDQEATAAGSASIDMVSGATYTSEGYLQSLQSALDKV